MTEGDTVKLEKKQGTRSEERNELRGWRESFERGRLNRMCRTFRGPRTISQVQVAFTDQCPSACADWWRMHPGWSVLNLGGLSRLGLGRAFRR